MSRQSIKVEIEPITGEEREATGSQDLSQGVDHPMSHVLCARTELKHRKNLGTRVDGQPEPQHLFGTAQPGAQFVQLQVRKQCSCKVCACPRVRVSHVVMVACR